MCKKTKIALILTLALLTLAVVSIGLISAADGPEVDIVYINISYGMRTEIKYAVAAKGLPEDAVIGVTAKVGSPTSKEERVADNEGVTTINGKQYVVFGLPIEADEMTQNFYATPYVDTASGRILGELEKDSIIEYAIRRRAELPEGGALARLLDTLLDYGARVQDYLGTDTGRLANSDFYRVDIVNGSLSDGFNYGYFVEGEEVVATASATPGFAAESWKNSAGQTVSEDAILTIPAPAKNETYTAKMVNTGENISYVLDGGTLPSGKWTQYPENADYTLPIPTKDGYVFAGWYTDPTFNIATNLSKIPAGSTDYFTLYAKWNKIVLSGDAAYLKKNLKTLCFVYDNAETYGGNGNALELEGDALVWTQGSVKTSQITLHKGIKQLVGNSGVFTFEFEIAKKAGESLFDTTIRLRRASKNETVNILKITKDGNVSIAGGGVIATLTENFTKIRITVDVLNGTISAYDEGGRLTESAKFGIPASVTSYSDWYDLLTDITWQWLANSAPTSGTSAIRIKGMSLIEGNPDVRGAGLPITIVNNSGEKKYSIIYDADSALAKDAADELNARLVANGLPTLDKNSDTVAETTREIVFGAADRAKTAELVARMTADKTIYDNGAVWVISFKEGKLYVLANNAYAYGKALDMIESYMAGGVFSVPGGIDLCDTMDEEALFFDSLIIDNPHAAYMSYETPDNFYEGYTDPFAALYSEYKEMTVTLVDAKTYRITYVDERGGTFSADFVQKRWGMWMMGAMKYTEKNGTTHSITSSSTDYEFVLRCGNEGSITFRSGNHADYTLKDEWDPDDSSLTNDRLLDMTFYDAKSGDSFTLAVGESKKVNGLRIVMHHNIYEQEYAQENVLMNVEKSYLYTGYDVLCDSKLYLAQDVTFKTSYSCMLPISKKYGNCAMFYLDDGSTVYMKTPLSNTADETRMGANASRIDLWGENNPAYHMTIDLLNTEHQLMSSDESKGYTGFREMLGGGSNKVYCSMFSDEGMLKYGSEINFSTRWSFSIQDDFENPDREPDYWVGLPE